MEVKRFEDWILFWDKVFFSTSWKVFEDKINLLPEAWPHIRKNKQKEFVIDYPGEYENYNIFVRVLKQGTNRLNFFIQDYNNKQYYAFIQDPSVLENLDLASYPDTWYFTDEVVEKQIERLWFEGETVKIEGDIRW